LDLEAAISTALQQFGVEHLSFSMEFATFWKLPQFGAGSCCCNRLCNIFEFDLFMQHGSLQLGLVYGVCLFLVFVVWF
jgi:hypothetical protein